VRDGVNAMVKELRNGTKPSDEDTGVTIVTKQNLDSPDVKAVLARAARTRRPSVPSRTSGGTVDGCWVVSAGARWPASYWWSGCGRRVPADAGRRRRVPSNL
jgi:hypothetical protein